MSELITHHEEERLDEPCMSFRIKRHTLKYVCEPEPTTLALYFTHFMKSMPEEEWMMLIPRFVGHANLRTKRKSLEDEILCVAHLADNRNITEPLSSCEGLTFNPQFSDYPSFDGRYLRVTHAGWVFRKYSFKFQEIWMILQNFITLCVSRTTSCLSQWGASSRL